MGAAALPLQIAGAANQAVSSVFGAMNDRLNLKMQSFFAKLNKQQALNDAREAGRQGEQAQQDVMLRTAQVKSSQRAAMGANGVDMSTGSALNRLISTDYMGERDRITVEQNTVRAVAGYRTDAVNYGNQARMASAARAGINPLLAGTSSLLGSAGSIAKDWYTMKTLGAFG